MSKREFKVGDKVRRVCCDFDEMKVGYEGVILKIGDDIDKSLYFKENNHWGYSPQYFELVEEEPFGKQFFGKKMKVTPETSAMVQQAVFDAGGSWYSGAVCVAGLESPFLCVSGEGRITRCFSELSFKSNKDFDEVVVEEVKTLKVSEPPVVEENKELLELRAKCDELDKAHKKLLEAVKDLENKS